MDKVDEVVEIKLSNKKIILVDKSNIRGHRRPLRPSYIIESKREDMVDVFKGKSCFMFQSDLISNLHDYRLKL